MHEAFVFSGPTLTPHQAKQLFPEATCLGPAAQGDVYEVCRHAPRVICFIDGYFEHELAVMHKELLSALKSGVAVFGAASMGALRAVELAPQGMIGVGEIFHAYQRKELENDDAVAVAHELAEQDYRRVSIAWVDLQATLRSPLARDLSGHAVARLLAAADALFYPERDLPTLLALCSKLDVPSEQAQQLKAFLAVSTNWRWQKRLDAELLLREVRTRLAHGRLDKPAVDFAFPNTHAWQKLVQNMTQQKAMSAFAGEISAARIAQLVLEEIQLLGPEVFSDVLMAAMHRALSTALLHAGDAETEPPAEPSAEHERRTRALILGQLGAVLTSSGDYHSVLERAASKYQLQATNGPGRGQEDDVQRYFEERLARPVPSRLVHYAQSVGCPDETALFAMIHREMDYLRARAKQRSS